MAEEHYTRCPACKTIFRVTPQQLALRAGQVRCGHCRTAFDAAAAGVKLTPRSAAEFDDSGMDEAALGPPTVTLRSSEALQSAVEVVPADSSASGSPSVPIGGSPDPLGVRPEGSFASRFSRNGGKTRRRLASLYAVAVPILTLLLLAQALIHFRDALAAQWPRSKPLLEQVCKTLRCNVEPLQNISALSIEASDLQADPAHKGLLVLSATVRNRGAYPLAYPYLELSLTDLQEQVVVRRAFAPPEYVTGTTDLSRGIPGDGELPVKVFLDASATVQAGYRLYLFYP